MRAASWPLEPRILFISGHDVPLDAHLDVSNACSNRTGPIVCEPVDDLPRHWTSEHLTVIEEATLDEVRTVAAARVHATCTSSPTVPRSRTGGRRATASHSVTAS